MAKKVIGIFSRDGEESYGWLINFLLTLPGVGDVRPVYIAPNSSRHFRDELSKCSFAVVYHTMNRGRLNLTDVADSLYDRELEALNARLGQKNVIVVIDDLRGREEKHSILRNQPRLGRLAQDVFLFTAMDKQEINEQPPYQMSGSAARNLQEMKKLIATESGKWWYCKWLLVILIVVLIVVICVIAVSYRPKHLTLVSSTTTPLPTTIHSTSGPSSTSGLNATNGPSSTNVLISTNGPNSTNVLISTNGPNSTNVLISTDGLNSTNNSTKSFATP